MALNKTTKLVIEGKSKVGDVEIAGYRAVIDVEDPDKMTFHPWQIDKDACKEHRKIVRADQAEFEDYAYLCQEEVISAK